MKIKSLIYIVIAITGISLFTACQNDNNPAIEAKEKTLVFYPTVGNRSEDILTRSTNSFFNVGDRISVELTTNQGTLPQNPYTYTYNSSDIFTGNFRFKLDNTYVTSLKALWPSQDVRDQGIITDQRKFSDYQMADRLKAEANTLNILPTAEPVPLSFTHEQSRLTFHIAGQNANGIYIKELIVELEADLGSGKTKTAFWAYCKADGSAELILPAGVEINPGTTDRYMIGLATIGSQGTTAKDYRGGIYIPGNTNITLQESTDYLVTLTPQGYDLTANIYINGFNQSEGYVGIPIQMPKKIAENIYSIESSLQLVTLSQLLKGGYIKGENATTWQGYQYTIANGLQITDNAKLYYQPISTSLKSTLFTGGVTTIKDTHGTDFNLFEE